MADYNNTNRGVLFKNDRKQTDNHPDYTGSVDINGIEHWLSAWVKQSKGGKSFMSLSIGKPKEAKADVAVQGAAQSTETNAFDDDLPF